MKISKTVAAAFMAACLEAVAAGPDLDEFRKECDAETADTVSALLGAPVRYDEKRPRKGPSEAMAEAARAGAPVSLETARKYPDFVVAVSGAGAAIPVREMDRMFRDAAALGEKERRRIYSVAVTMRRRLDALDIVHLCEYGKLDAWESRVKKEKEDGRRIKTV